MAIAYYAAPTSLLRSEASYYGPSYMIDYLWHDYHGYDGRDACSSTATTR